MRAIILFYSFFSLSSFAMSPCEKRVDEILKEYKNNDLNVVSHNIKHCSKVISNIPGVMNSNTNTNAPEIKSSSACVILLKTKQNSIEDLVVIDEENDFELMRNFDNSNKETISLSRFGNSSNGTILFIKSEGDYLDDLGFLNKTYFITRANYDLEQDKMKLLKWKLKWFSNKYSHDYSVQCK